VSEIVVRTARKGDVERMAAAWLDAARLEAPVPDPEAKLVLDATEVRLLVDGLVVEKAFRRRGVGTRLMRAAEEWGRSRGARLALLDTWGESPQSVPFYEGLGYTPRSIRFRPLTRR